MFLNGMVISKERKKQERTKQYTSGNQFQRGQREDQRYVGGMLKKYTGVKSAKLGDRCPGQKKIEGSGGEGQNSVLRILSLLDRASS